MQTATATKPDRLQELTSQAGNFLDVKLQINLLEETLEEFSELLRDEVEARGNSGFTITVPGKGKVLAKAAVPGGVVGTELKVDADVFERLPRKKQQQILDSGVLVRVDKVRSARASAISYQPNV